MANRQPAEGDGDDPGSLAGTVRLSVVGVGAAVASTESVGDEVGRTIGVLQAKTITRTASDTIRRTIARRIVSLEILSSVDGERISGTLIVYVPG
jgi:hypothetical protein